jgi:acyl carrier protein
MYLEINVCALWNYLKIYKDINMVDRVTKLFAGVLGVNEESLNNSSSPDTVSQWDSLASMHLVAEIEDVFKIELSTRDIMKMQSIGIVKTVLIEKGVLNRDLL